jgi:hypothetical protein
MGNFSSISADPVKMQMELDKRQELVKRYDQGKAPAGFNVRQYQSFLQDISELKTMIGQFSYPGASIVVGNNPQSDSVVVVSASGKVAPKASLSYNDPVNGPTSLLFDTQAKAESFAAQKGIESSAVSVLYKGSNLLLGGGSRTLAGLPSGGVQRVSLVGSTIQERNENVVGMPLSVMGSGTTGRNEYLYGMIKSDYLPGLPVYTTPDSKGGGVGPQGFFIGNSFLSNPLANGLNISEARSKMGVAGSFLGATLSDWNSTKRVGGEFLSGLGGIPGELGASGARLLSIPANFVYDKREEFERARGGRPSVSDYLTFNVGPNRLSVKEQRKGFFEGFGMGSRMPSVVSSQFGERARASDFVNAAFLGVAVTNPELVGPMMLGGTALSGVEFVRNPSEKSLANVGVNAFLTALPYTNRVVDFGGVKIGVEGKRVRVEDYTRSKTILVEGKYMPEVLTQNVMGDVAGILKGKGSRVSAAELSLWGFDKAVVEGSSAGGYLSNPSLSGRGSSSEYRFLVDVPVSVKGYTQTRGAGELNVFGLSVFGKTIVSGSKEGIRFGVGLNNPISLGGVKGFTEVGLFGRSSIGMAAPTSRLRGNLLLGALDLTNPERVRIGSMFSAAKELRYEKGLRVYDWANKVEGFKRPKASARVIEDFSNSLYQGKFFGTITMEMLPKGKRAVKWGDIDISTMSSVGDVNKIAPFYVEKLKGLGEDVSWNPDKLSIEFPGGGKVLEVKSGKNQYVLGLGDEATPGFYGLELQSKGSVKFGRARSIPLGQQFERKVAASLIFSSGKYPGETTSFSGAGVLGKQAKGNARGLKDVSDMFVTGYGISELKQDKVGASWEQYKGLKGKAALDRAFESFTKDQQRDILGKMGERTGRKVEFDTRAGVDFKRVTAREVPKLVGYGGGVVKGVDVVSSMNRARVLRSPPIARIVNVSPFGNAKSMFGGVSPARGVSAFGGVSPARGVSAFNVASPFMSVGSKGSVARSSPYRGSSSVAGSPYSFGSPYRGSSPYNGRTPFSTTPPKTTRFGGSGIGDFFGKASKSKSSKEYRSSYVPSLQAEFFQIKGARPSQLGVASGLSFRPITR